MLKQKQKHIERKEKKKTKKDEQQQQQHFTRAAMDRHMTRPTTRTTTTIMCCTILPPPMTYGFVLMITKIRTGTAKPRMSFFIVKHCFTTKIVGVGTKRTTKGLVLRGRRWIFRTDMQTHHAFGMSHCSGSCPDRQALCLLVLHRVLQRLPQQLLVKLLRS